MMLPWRLWPVSDVCFILGGIVSEECTSSSQAFRVIILGGSLEDNMVPTS
jgi:hypothetical protein